MLNNYIFNYNSYVSNNIIENYKVFRGIVTKLKDGVATIIGLESAKAGEIVEFENGSKGLVLNLAFKDISVVIFGNERLIKENMKVRNTEELMSIEVSTAIIGRVINVIGEFLDSIGKVVDGKNLNIERKAVGIIARQSVHEPMLTGFKSLDALIPIGRGQRELIIGDRQTGKTSIAVDSIINQINLNANLDFRNNNMYCVYVAIGQKKSTAARIFEIFKKFQTIKFTTIVSAFASESASLQYLAPYVGCTIGEYFRDNKKHSLVVYDDLSKQAVAYRQMSLLLRRPPGREAYPGDVFYLHSRLLERSAKLSKNLGSGSQTGLPIIETLEGDVSAYIPTNVISITDGQIFLDTEQFYAGIRPAVNVGLSVSRVGAAAQPKLMKSIAGSLKVGLAQFREVASFASLGCDIDPITQRLLDRGNTLIELFKQSRFNVFSLFFSLLVVFLGSTGFFDSVKISDITSIFFIAIEKVKMNFFNPFTSFIDLIHHPVKENVKDNMLQKYIFSLSICLKILI
jgi:F-type H+-transporting ATPase subunit alpha